MLKIIITLSVVFLYTSSLRAQCFSIDNTWTSYYTGTDVFADRFLDMKVCSTSGNIYVTGQTSTAGGANLDYITTKYNSNGGVIWSRKYDGPRSGNDIAHSIAIDDSENVYVTGESLGLLGDNYDFETIKYDSSGNLKWIDKYNGTASAQDYAYSIFVDANHFVYVTGSGRETGGNAQDIVTIKYTSGGTRVWTKKYDFGSNDYGTKVIADSSGNVYVTGQVSGAGTGHDYLTIKYNSSGTQLWAKRFDHLNHADDDPSDIGLDYAGNVYVTGTSHGFVGKEYCTIKYSSTGDSLWFKEYFYVGEGNEANAMYVDSAGNVYVTGYDTFVENGHSTDFLTIKYNTNGVTNSGWTKRYNGLQSGPDVARSIFPGKNGKIFVGGGSRGIPADDDDFVVVEYDMATMNECTVNRISIPGSDNILTMGIDLTRNKLYAAGETTAGLGNYDGMVTGYCLTGPVTIDFNIKASIEGLYNTATNKLNIRDTVRAYLRYNVSPFTIAGSAIAVLDSSTLTMIQSFPEMASGVYYLVLKHRNSLETWSMTGGEIFACGGPMSYDFTDSLTKAYGNNMVFKGGKYSIYSGDVDQDGFIDLTDELLIYNDGSIFKTGYVFTDINGDRIVDLLDLLITYNNAVNFVSLIRP